MRGRNMLVQLVVAVLWLTFSAALLAQEALTQTFTSSDGLFTMSYPEGWTVAEEDDLIRFSSDQAFLQVNYYDYGEDVTPLEVLEIGTPEALGFSPPESLVVAGYAALQSAGTDQLHTILNFCDGVMALAIGYVPPGEVETYKPTFMAMLETIRYGEGEPEVCRGAFEGLAPITAANAGQVAQVGTLGDETVAVASVAFSGDGGLLAAGLMDGSVHLWSLVTGEEQEPLTGHRDGVTGVAIDQGGYNLAAGDGNGQVRLWEIATGDGLGMLQEHTAAVESVAFGPNSLIIASAAADGARLWSLINAGEVALTGGDSAAPAHSVAFSPDGTTLATAGGGTIQLWNVDSGAFQSALEAEISDITSISFRPDGALLVYSGADGSVWAWDMASDNHVVVEGDGSPVSALAFSPDGQIVASGGASAVSLWDATGASLVTLTSPASDTTSVAFRPDGTLLASGGDSGGVVLWGTSAAGAQDSAASDTTSTTDETTSGTTAETTTTGGTTAACTISAPNTANLRSGPGTDFDRAGALAAGQTASVDGQTTGTDGMTWYRLTDGAWVRSDVISAPAECATVPAITP